MRASAIRVLARKVNDRERKTLRDIAKPIGVSTYRVTRELPSPVRDELPTVEDLQAVVTKLRKEMKQQRDREET